MARFYPLPVVLFILLLTAPTMPVTARAGTPAAPADPPSTFNVTRLGVYDFPPNYDGKQVTADEDRAFLTDGTTVNLYDITNPYAPSFENSIPGDTGYAVVDIDAELWRLARLSTNSGIDIVLEVYDVSPGGTFTPRCSLHFDWSTWSFPQTVLIHDYGRYVYVGFSQGLAVVDVSNPVNGACKAVEANHDLKQVHDIVQVVDKLYLATATDVLVFSVADPSDPRDPVSYPVAAGQPYRVAVSDNGAIFAATMNPWGLTVIYDGAYGAYPQTYRVSVVADGNLVYVGTDQDLQVVDALDLQKPLPIKLPLIGRYGDYGARFYADLALSSGLKVHSPKGIFQYKPEPPALLLEAQSAGVALNGTPLASGTSVVALGDDRITLAAPAGAAALKLRCSVNSAPRPELGVRHVVNRSALDPVTTFLVVKDLLGLWIEDECGRSASSAPLQAHPPALPLSLMDGGARMQVPAAAGAVRVDTTFASSRAAGGATFEASHAPGPGISHFVCLAGTLQVQPTAAGAPLLTLGPGQFVDVTAAGAGPVGQYHYVYLPLLRR